MFQFFFICISFILRQTTLIKSKCLICNCMDLKQKQSLDGNGVEIKSLSWSKSKPK